MMVGSREPPPSNPGTVATALSRLRSPIVLAVAGSAVAVAFLAWLLGASTIGGVALACVGALGAAAGAAAARRSDAAGSMTGAARLMGANQVRALLDHAPARITLKDLEGRFVLINRSAEDWFRLRADQVVGRHTRDVFPPELAKVYERADRLVLESGGPQQTQISHPRDGRILHASLLKFPIRADDGSIVGIGSIGTDITGRQDAERALLDAKEAAERANHLKSAFLAAMSHELRTPLNAIIGFTDLIAMQPYGDLGDRRYLEYVQDVGSSGRHLLGIVNDILDLARIEAGRETLAEETVDPEELVESVMRTMQVHADHAGVDLRLRVGRSLPLLHCDPRRVRQILFNLVSNGVKFTPAGGLVTVAVRVVGDLEIEVRDTGVGIPAHEIADIFEPFNRIVNHLTRGAEGAGLGLALTQRFVQMHEGSISVTSAPGTGTAVTVRIPASRLFERAEVDAPA